MDGWMDGWMEELCQTKYMLAFLMSLSLAFFEVNENRKPARI